MGIANAISRIIVSKDGVNDLRRARYEAYYLTLNHRASRSGFWIRYTQDRRGPKATPSEAALWFHWFRPEAPTESVGFKQSFPLEALAEGPDAHIRIGQAYLSDRRAIGEAHAPGHRASWDLRFEPATRAIWFAPEPFRLLRLKTPAVVSNADIRYSGSIRVDGAQLTLADDPGCQQHNWGRRRSHALWGHCNAFDGDVPCHLETAAAYLGSRLKGSVFIRYRGQDYLNNALHTVLLTQVQIDFPAFSFVCGSRGTEFHGTFEAPVEALRQVTYEDFDGGKSYCANTEIGNLTLEVRQGGKVIEILKATNTAHFEFLKRSPWQGVAVSVP